MRLSEVRIATLAYAFAQPRSWQDYIDGLSERLDEACDQGAQLLVLPEYAAMEMAALAGEEVAMDLALSLHAVAQRMPARIEWFAAQARHRGCWIASGSGPIYRDGQFINQAQLHGPQGQCLQQDKLIMTRFEREQWQVAAGRKLTVLETPFGSVGILICYDSEFPLLARKLVAQGAQCLLVPSCTDTRAGAQRVRIACQARALENQCVVVRACTVGEAPWCPAVDINHGSAAIHGPPDVGWPEDGVLAEGGVDQPGWVFADLAIEAIDAVRRHGAVLNHLHWAEQHEALGKKIPAQGGDLNRSIDD